MVERIIAISIVVGVLLGYVVLIGWFYGKMRGDD